MSSLCTAAVVWIMMKWEARADEADSDKYLILIAYVIGLSIGVHLLNLLTLPALAFVYYYRRSAQPSLGGGVLTLALAFVIIVLGAGGHHSGATHPGRRLRGVLYQ